MSNNNTAPLGVFEILSLAIVVILATSCNSIERMVKAGKEILPRDSINSTSSNTRPDNCNREVRERTYDSIMKNMRHGRSRIDIQQVDSIRIWAEPKGVESPRDLDYWDLLADPDTTIYDRIFIEMFVEEVNQLKSGGMPSIDCRCAAVVYEKSGVVSLLCFGEKWGTQYNRRMMTDRPSLFALIDSAVYGPHSNEYWLGPELRAITRRIERIDSQLKYIDRSKRLRSSFIERR